MTLDNAELRQAIADAAKLLRSGKVAQEEIRQHLLALLDEQKRRAIAGK